MSEDTKCSPGVFQQFYEFINLKSRTVLDLGLCLNIFKHILLRFYMIQYFQIFIGDVSGFLEGAGGAVFRQIPHFQREFFQM